MNDDVMSKEKLGTDTGGENAGEGSKVAKKPWNIEVDVVLTKGCPSPQFVLHTPLPILNGDIQFNNNHRPGFNITFNLIDETGDGYTFGPQSKKDDACWSQAGSVCPTSPCDDVFKVKSIKDQGMTLEVYNDNPSPAIGPFQFNLRVTKDGGSNYCDLDPGGNDGNGPRS